MVPLRSDYDATKNSFRSCANLVSALFSDFAHFGNGLDLVSDVRNGWSLRNGEVVQNRAETESYVLVGRKGFLCDDFFYVIKLMFGYIILTETVRRCPAEKKITY